ncbi:MAG: AGE family epimerase/isomerase, partial [Phycisphaerales bacterium JB038]
MTIDFQAHLEAYREALLGDTIPFWLRHGMDREHGGVLTCLGRDGAVIDTDKSVWFQGRFAWMLATLHNTVEERQEWLEAAVSCLDFLEEHAFDEDGRMFFLLTQEGKPLRKRRYVFSEAFACMAFAAAAKATGSDAYAERARSLFQTFTRHSYEPGLIPPKTDQTTRPGKGIGPVMICLNLAQVLRETIGLTDADDWIERCVTELERDFCKPELGVVLETVGPDGEIIDHFDGRTLNPGHA